jgi:hypothetical protein
MILGWFSWAWSDFGRTCLEAAILIGVVWLGTEVRRWRKAVRLQHVVLTSAGTMHGLVAALEAGLEAGGLDPDARRRIYEAHDEAYGFLADAVGAYDPENAPVPRRIIFADEASRSGGVPI